MGRPMRRTEAVDVRRSGASRSWPARASSAKGIAAKASRTEHRETDQRAFNGLSDARGDPDHWRNPWTRRGVVSAEHGTAEFNEGRSDDGVANTGNDGAGCERADG